MHIHCGEQLGRQIGTSPMRVGAGQAGRFPGVFFREGDSSTGFFTTGGTRRPLTATMKHQTNIVLIGFKSCGKTTVGKILAQSLQKTFIDLDETIERVIQKEYGRPIGYADFYAQHGATTFRDIEQRALQSHRNERNVVLATGGGAPVAPQNRALLKHIGIVCYIKTPPQVLLARYQQTRLPPFLAPEPTLSALERIWNARDTAYQAIADLVVAVQAHAPDEIAELILRTPADLSTERHGDPRPPDRNR